MSLKRAKAKVPLLPGAPTQNVEAIRGKYTEGFFNYQFQNKGSKRSRVMHCDSEEELDFIVRQVSQGARVYIEVGPRRST